MKSERRRPRGAGSRATTALVICALATSSPVWTDAQPDGVYARPCALCPRPDVLLAGRQTPEDPDALYRERENPASAARAAAIWADRLAKKPADFESAWKLARLRYWLGTRGPEAGRRGELEAGMDAARKAMAAEARRPEGHFWLAANMGALAESHGLRNGLRYRKPVKAALELVIQIDPAYLQGAGDRALGRWYHRVPSWFGGSKEKAVEHLQRALRYGPNSIINHFFLAEVLRDMGRRAEARAELQKVLDTPVDPDWAPEDEQFKERARALLRQLG